MRAPEYREGHVEMRASYSRTTILIYRASTDALGRRIEAMEGDGRFCAAAEKGRGAMFIRIDGQRADARAGGKASGRSLRCPQRSDLSQRPSRSDGGWRLDGACMRSDYTPTNRRLCSSKMEFNARIEASPSGTDTQTGQAQGGPRPANGLLVRLPVKLAKVILT